VPPPGAEEPNRSEEGSASVELVGILPFLLLAILAAAQLGLAGQALWSAAVAARAGAREELVGGRAARSARAALPPALRVGATVRAGEGVGVEVPVPRLLPGMREASVGARTRLGPAGG
jgi:TadE-like protein